MKCGFNAQCQLVSQVRTGEKLWCAKVYLLYK